MALQIVEESPEKFQLNRKTVLSLLGLTILMVGIPIGIYLSLNQQTIKSQAAQEKEIVAPETGFNLKASRSSRIGVGERVLVWINLRSDIDPINQISANLTYPEDKLELLSVKTDLTSLKELNSSCAGGIYPSVTCPKDYTCKIEIASNSAVGTCLSKDLTKSTSVVKDLQSETDSLPGQLKLQGELNNLKTQIGEEKLMAGLIFLVKQEGEAQISLTEGEILRAADSVNLFRSGKTLKLNLTKSILAPKPQTFESTTAASPSATKKR